MSSAVAVTILHRDVIDSSIVDAGYQGAVFLPTKKKPAPAGEEEGQMIPAARDSPRYFSMASVSGLDRENRRPPGGWFRA